MPLSTPPSSPSQDVPPSPSSVRSAGGTSSVSANHNASRNQQLPPRHQQPQQRGSGGGFPSSSTRMSHQNLLAAAAGGHNNNNHNNHNNSHNNLPTAASTRSLAEMSARSMDSPRSAIADRPHEVIEFLKAQSVEMEDCDTYKKIFDEQLLRNFNDVKSFGEDRLASSGVKRGHARRIFAEIEKRDRDAAARQRQQQQNRRGGGGLRQSVSTANLYGALYDMTPVATPVAGESHGLFPNIGSSQTLESLAVQQQQPSNNNNNNTHHDPHNTSANKNNNNTAVDQDAAPMNVIVNNSARAKADPFRTSAVVVPGDFVCNLCCELLYSARTVPCGHTFCALCLERWAVSQQGNPTCPLCRANLIPKGQKEFELPAVNSLLESLCQRCFPGRYQRSANSAEEQRRSDEEIKLAYSLVRHPADGLLVKILLNNININRPLELLFLRLPRREFLPPSFLPSANRIECGSISPTQVEGYGFNMTSAALHATIMSALQLEPGHWFLDAGAGTGIVAAWAATLVGPTGTSLALDHDTKAAQLMRRNRIIHDQLLYHPTMPLSGANFAGEVTVLNDRYCLFPNLASAPIAGRRTQFQNLLLNPGVYETGNNRFDNNNDDASTNADDSPSNRKSKPLPLAVQILGIERSSAFLDRFAGTNTTSSSQQQNPTAAAANGLSPQSQQSQPFGGGGCVVHATVTIGNSSTSSRRQCRMVGTVRLVSKTDQFQVLSASQHQHAKNAMKSRITPSTHPRSSSVEQDASTTNNNNTNGNNNNNHLHEDSEDEDQDSSGMIAVDQIPPVLPTLRSRLAAARHNNTNSTHGGQHETASLSDESVLCEVTDRSSYQNTQNNNNNQSSGPTNFQENEGGNNEDAAEKSSSGIESKLNQDHHILFSLREVNVFGSDDTSSVFNFGDSQTVDQERLMRFTFCLTKPIGELLADSAKQEEREKQQRMNGDVENGDGMSFAASNSNKAPPIDAFGVFVASLVRRSDVVATSKLQLLDGQNVIRQLKRWIDGTWIPSEFKPNKYHCLQTNVYDLSQVLFGRHCDRAQSVDARQRVLELIKPKMASSSTSSRSGTPGVTLTVTGASSPSNDNTTASQTSLMNDEMMVRAETAPPPRPPSEAQQLITTHKDNNNNNNNTSSTSASLAPIFNSSHGFFDRVFLACEPQSEADLKRFQRLLRPGGRMVVPFDSELWLITRPSSSSPSASGSTQQPNSGDHDAVDPFEETFPRESLYQVGFGTFVSPDHQHNDDDDTTKQNDDDNNEDEELDEAALGTPRSGPIHAVTKKINEAIEDEKYHMRQLEESYRLYSLSAMRNRSLKNSPFLTAAPSPASSKIHQHLMTTTPAAPFVVEGGNNHNGTNTRRDSVGSTSSSNPRQHHQAQAQGRSNSVGSTTSSQNTATTTTSAAASHQNESIYLRCCGNKLSSAKWSDTINVMKIWGSAPFSDGATICINKPEPFCYSEGSTFVRRARGSSYLAYNVDLCARMSYVECAHCSVIVGAEFCDEPLLTQPDGPWTGRVLLCSSMICREKDLAAYNVGSTNDTPSGLMDKFKEEAIKCSECAAPLALPTWRLKTEMDLRLRHGSRSRSILASADYNGLVFSRIRPGAIEDDVASNGNNSNGNGNTNSNNNNNKSASSTQHIKLVNDANLDIINVNCSSCKTHLGFRIVRCRTPFAKTRYAFSLNRIALNPSKVKGMPTGGLRQPQNLMERIYRAIAQSFGINPTEGAQFILRDGSGNATVFDGGNLVTMRDGREQTGEEEEDDDDEDEHDHEDDDDEEETTGNLDAVSTARNDPELDRARRLRNLLIEDAEENSNNSNSVANNNNRPQNPTPLDEDDDNNNSIPTIQQANRAMAGQLAADFDLYTINDENDVVVRNNDNNSNTGTNNRNNDNDGNDDVIDDR